jgi:hypothetical protein
MTLRPVNLTKFNPPLAMMMVWDHFKAREVGDRFDSFPYKGIGIQIEGEFSGAVVNIEGSNDGEHWYTLLDSQNNHFTLSFSGMADIGQMSRFLRPAVTGGNETTGVSVFALCRGI